MAHPTKALASSKKVGGYVDPNQSNEHTTAPERLETSDIMSAVSTYEG